MGNHTLEALLESLDADILDPEAYTMAEVEAELEAAGCDVARLVADGQRFVDGLLAKRREAWERGAHQRITNRALERLAEKR